MWLHHLSGLCCGIPVEETLAYVAELLEVFAIDGDDPRWNTDRRRLYEWRETKDGALILSWLDHLDLTEHGTSIPGWITDKGNTYLRLYKLWTAEQGNPQLKPNVP